MALLTLLYPQTHRHKSVGYEWGFGFLLRYMPLFWKGVGVTLAYTAGTILIGLLLGLLIGLGRLSRHWVVKAPLIGLIEIFRCTPLLVQIIWFYYALPVILNVQIPAVVAATAVLSLYTAAFYAEIFRGGIVSIEAGQWDAAKALGLSRWHVMRRVILPQAIRIALPPYGNIMIMMLKDSSQASTITVAELALQGKLIASSTFKNTSVYTMVALMYLALSLPLILLVRHFEAKGRRR